MTERWALVALRTSLDGRVRFLDVLFDGHLGHQGPEDGQQDDALVGALVLKMAVKMDIWDANAAIEAKRSGSSAQLASHHRRFAGWRRSRGAG